MEEKRATRLKLAAVERKKEVRARRGRVGESEFRSPETGDKIAERVRMGVIIGVVVVESVVSWGQRVTSRELRRTQHGQPPAASGGERESERLDRDRDRRRRLRDELPVVERDQDGVFFALES